MAPNQPPQTPPHVSLRCLRTATGLSLEQVAQAATEVLRPETPINRGTISAIELGIRGASRQMLDALAIAYGLNPGDITTDYAARSSRVHQEAS